MGNEFERPGATAQAAEPDPAACLDQADSLDQAVCMGLVLNGAMAELHADAQDAVEAARRRVVQVEEVRLLWRQTPRDERRQYEAGYGTRLSALCRQRREQAAREQRDLSAFESNPSKWLAVELRLFPVADWDLPVAAAAEYGSHAGVVGLAIAEG